MGGAFQFALGALPPALRRPTDPSSQVRQQEAAFASHAPSKLEAPDATLALDSLMIDLTVAKQRPQFGLQPRDL
jgi:hypothetical protein